ncbi:hypothetical protein J0676_10235 [Vibrio sp. Vb2880]|uniref:Uncharacterized protein n=1 Tax=Vibrio furnissii TaxID=29494 RepID=A0A0Q2RMY7_VIBFU|nr:MULTISPECIES: hypothetical protein [Vibrio]ADT87618.1 hypothetical protein vfu_A02492 [Vibrio furnissii NCTC 11218]EEX42224.1 hypothetical protein VFA_002066 [Vibrio furnissii CIP 102972]KQH85350.1 hypothetical protein AMR76_12625 [Vibrio furnissii]MBO0213875.1 hypothetical protein [Vibrio sp. Vb2880]MCG6210372.1 hypothetical protein [Vibrio furnissii]
MNPVGVGSAQLYSPQTVRSQATANNDAKSESAPLKVEQNKVTLSEEGKALLAALKEIEEGKTPNIQDKSLGDKVEAFTYGALGMGHPDDVKKEDDSSYSAGQYLSAAATVGSILLLL